ncbi:MAG: hypothetical protein Ct9H90mP5_06990 [Acidimicrobiaceae bacterium]|nr:MAG: hypothetical protein Ct9H90mP5_06990 [Acidimicrobiaceae bacterium]
MNDNGGLSWAANRSTMSSDHIYNWAENHELAEPFVTDSSIRSPVVSTIDLSARVDADEVIAICRITGYLISVVTESWEGISYGSLPFPRY